MRLEKCCQEQVPNQLLNLIILMGWQKTEIGPIFNIKEDQKKNKSRPIPHKLSLPAHH